MNLSVDIAGVKLENPTVLASGIMGMTAESMIKVEQSGAGAITIKSIGPVAREGHKGPKVVVWEHGMANCYGLTSVGYKNMEDEWQKLEDLKVPLIASIYGGSVKEFVEVAEFVAKKNVAMIEINISCPNTKEHGMIFGVDKASSYKVVSNVKDVVGKIPIMPKLTPQALNIGEIAKTCEEAGANAISAINTVGPGMFINIDIAKPVLSFKKGGLSGPAIKPIAVRCIHDIYQAVKLPILGMGGVSNGRDAIELMMAGASAVAMGTSIYYQGLDVFKKVCDEMCEWLKKNDYKSVKDIVGVVHD